MWHSKKFINKLIEIIQSIQRISSWRWLKKIVDDEIYEMSYGVLVWNQPHGEQFYKITINEIKCNEAPKYSKILI